LGAKNELKVTGYLHKKNERYSKIIDYFDSLPDLSPRTNPSELNSFQVDIIDSSITLYSGHKNDLKFTIDYSKFHRTQRLAIKLPNTIKFYNNACAQIPSAANLNVEKCWIELYLDDANVETYILWIHLHPDAKKLSGS